MGGRALTLLLPVLNPRPCSQYLLPVPAPRPCSPLLLLLAPLMAFLDSGFECLRCGIASSLLHTTDHIPLVAGGSIPSLPANILLVKNVSVSGLFWGAHFIHDPAALLR